jgi:hypothetical protein
MQLPIKYDLADMVNSANGNINIKKILWCQLENHLKMLGFLTVWDLALRSNHEIQWLANSIITSGWFTFNVSLQALAEQKFRDKRQVMALAELYALSLKLYDLGCKTNPGLLIESEVEKTEHRLIFNEKYKPIIKQNKYIMVPTYDGLRNIKDTSILQEHIFGSGIWMLSYGRPQKQLKYSPSFG